MRMFRTVRAGRSWVRALELTIAAPPRHAACVLMKPGSTEPPVFMIPGSTGSVLQLGPLAAALPSPMPFYAVKPRGVAEGETPCRRIEEMAEYSIGVMRAQQPAGPYLLVGYSVGGLVALEMARQLTAAGEDVPLVVLLDTYPSRQIWPLRCHLEIFVRETGAAMASLRRQARSQIIRELGRRIRGLSTYLAASGVKILAPPPIVIEGCNAAARRLHLASVKAGDAYRPSRYSGRVVFVQPEEIPKLTPRVPAQVWGKFLTDLEICRVPGSHLAMLETYAATVASEISRCLARALPMWLPGAAPRDAFAGAERVMEPR